MEEERWVEVGQGRGRNGAWVSESGGREKKIEGERVRLCSRTDENE